MENHTANSVTIRWEFDENELDRPSAFEGFTLIIQNEIFNDIVEEEADSRQIKITGLEPYTDYFVSIAAKASDVDGKNGNFSRSGTGTPVEGGNFGTLKDLKVSGTL